MACTMNSFSTGGLLLAPLFGYTFTHQGSWDSVDCRRWRKIVIGWAGKLTMTEGHIYSTEDLRVKCAGKGRWVSSCLNLCQELHFMALYLYLLLWDPCWHFLLSYVAPGCRNLKAKVKALTVKYRLLMIMAQLVDRQEFLTWNVNLPILLNCVMISVFRKVMSVRKFMSNSTHLWSFMLKRSKRDNAAKRYNTMSPVFCQRALSQRC